MKPVFKIVLTLLLIALLSLGCTKDKFRSPNPPDPSTSMPNTSMPGGDSVDANKDSLVMCADRAIISAKLVQVGSLSAARTSIKTATAGNKILFIGGWNYDIAYHHSNVSLIVDVYDFVKNTWSTSYLYGAFREGLAVASLGNKIFISGGGDFMGDWITPRVDIYDAANNTWSVANMSEPRQHHAAASVGNKVVFASGFGYPNGMSWGNLSTVDIYDNATNSW